MSAFLDGLGKVFGKIADQVQGRIERLKNEKRDLENERKIIKEKLDKQFSPSGSRRIIAIDERILQIQGIIESKASD